MPTHQTTEKSQLYKRLYENPGSKRILTLDGGGIRGALTLGYLEEIEKVLRDKHNDPDLLLCDYYDLIVGTSTGGIIAAGLATGMSAQEIRKMYLDLGPIIFGKKRVSWLKGLLRIILFADYDEKPLEKALEKTFGNITIGDQNAIKTGLAIVTKRVNTLSTWPVHNFHNGKYYQYNCEILLSDLLRATSAAPSFFRAKKMKIDLKGTEGIFIDGGVSLANNPSFQGLMLATLKGFSLGWPMGADKMMVTSVGTGISTKTVATSEIENIRTAMWGKRIPDIFMEDAAYFNQALMQWLSDSETAVEIDGEMGDLKEDTVLGYKPLTYNRYNIKLDEKPLKTLTGKTYSLEELNALRQMDNAANRFDLANIGQKDAAINVKARHFPTAFDIDTTPQTKIAITGGNVPDYSFQQAVKKPIPIRAHQMESDFTVETLEGLMQGSKGDYLIVGVRGEMYPIKKDIFEETYEVK